MRWAVLAIAIACQHAAAPEATRARTQDIPQWADEALRRPEFSGDYALSTSVSPHFLAGDFDGDGLLDVAVLVLRRATGERGLAILHAGSARPFVVGAGRALGNGGADFSWMDAWSVRAKGPVQPGADGAAPPRLLGDALVVEKLESASAIVYWDGRTYRWYQQGD